LQSRKLVEPEKAAAAEEQATKGGQDIVSVLFQMQLIPPSDAAKVLGEYAVFLLDRALMLWRGAFTYSKDAAPPAGAFPLGSKWALLAESVRRLDVTLLRARLGKRLSRPVVRSGGLGVGKVEELGLNAQETRIYAAIDGTKSGEELLRAHDPATAVRLLYLLTELGHLGLAEVADESEAAAPRATAAPPPAPPSAPPKAAPAAAPEVIGDDTRRKEYEGELDGKAENVDVSRIFAAEENFQKAEIFIKARKYQEGLDLLEQAIEMNGEEAEFYAWRGYARFLLAKDRKQSFEECASDCRKAIKMVDRCLPAHLFL